MLGSVLIANRGEIALRVARTCRALGIRVIAATSTADRDSAVTRLADRTVVIGASSRCYLDVAAIVQAALVTGAEAVHPGYGFLSEDADLADACARHGLVFIGPTGPVIRKLGDKAAARAAMVAAGLPVLPGTTDLADVEHARTEAGRIGYPVLLKAVAGGGGRGMRMVADPRDLAAAYAEVTAQARSLFGDGRLFLERFLAPARHVEVQVLCDEYGTGIHLGNRDCSVQRRRQKLIEESPAPTLPAVVAERMAADTVRAALATGYRGVGTFEFLVDSAHRYYFMEVNCRIQVEHPVTEMVSRIDLVAEQLRVAAGERLSLRQEDVRLHGTAIECRVNAEDPTRDFLPTPGRLSEFSAPGGPFVRVDTHSHPGYRIPPDYDSLIAKVIVWAPDRRAAIERMKVALSEFRVDGPGVHTTRDFLTGVLNDPRFVDGKHDTDLLAAVPPG